eukprot:8656135-Lingulodinium_polyedra.AAC.1
MLAHIKLKKKQWETGKGDHPAWLVNIFKAIKENTQDIDEEDMEPKTAEQEPGETQEYPENMAGCASGKENSLENK